MRYGLNAKPAFVLRDFFNWPSASLPCMWDERTSSIGESCVGRRLRANSCSLVIHTFSSFTDICGVLLFQGDGEDADLRLFGLLVCFYWVGQIA